MKIKFDEVSFSYDKKDKNALNNINLTLEESEIVFVMGHTGSGKSTLIQHINGLLVSNKGSVSVSLKENNFVLNRDAKIKNINDLRKDVGIVFQFPEYQLFETTVLKDVMFGPYNFFKDEQVAKEMAIKALKKVGINESYYNRSPFDLSGGEKRKVAIAGVLASNPSIVIMDEPTSSLDPAATKEMMNLVKELKDEGKLVIVISHDTNLSYEFADRVIIMSNGEIIKNEKTCDAFSDISVLKQSSLVEPFVCKIKRILNVKDDSIRNVDGLKEVIKNG